MAKSLREANQERLNLDAKYSDFPVGSRVKVVCLCQDFHFFNPDTQNTNGTVVRNSGSYLGIRVSWDEPREYEDGYIQEEFGFNPSDLILLEVSPKTDQEKLVLLQQQIRDFQKEVPKEFEETFKKHFWNILA